MSAMLFDDNRGTPARGLLFEAPSSWIIARSGAQVEEALARADRERSAGRYLAGYFAYELGAWLEPKLKDQARETGTPLLCLGVFGAPEVLGAEAVKDWLKAKAGSPARIGKWKPGWDEAAYAAAFAKVKEAIAAGDAYQINLTFPLTFAFSGHPAALFAQLREKARAAYGAYLETPDETVLSLSPELFIEIEGGAIRTRPMKGTVRREPDPDLDEATARALGADEKQRAENLMIVDLLRNDLSRVTKAGSVRVTDLFQVETYPTLHTMTSTVHGRLREDVSIRELLHAVFPCGSVTGAPKIKAMEIIAALEPGPRGIYCGAIGWFAPDGSARANVAIRTAVIRDGEGTMPVGSGIVFDSSDKGEYAECLLKANFLTEPYERFGLIETMLWRPGEGIWLVDLHRRRLERSARYWSFAHDGVRIEAALETAMRALPARPHRLRLVLEQEGEVAITAAPFDAPPSETQTPWGRLPLSPEALTLGVSPERIGSRSPHQRHKTTMRHLYDGEFERLSRETGCGEVIFLNERGEIAEGSRTNLFIVRDGALLTPPLSAGCLDGVLRRHLMTRARPPVRECPLTLDDLMAAEAIFVGNSLRGLIRIVSLAREGQGEASSFRSLR